MPRSIGTSSRTGPDLTERVVNSGASSRHCEIYDVWGKRISLLKEVEHCLLSAAPTLTPTPGARSEISIVTLPFPTPPPRADADSNTDSSPPPPTSTPTPTATQPRLPQKTRRPCCCWRRGWQNRVGAWTAWYCTASGPGGGEMQCVGLRNLMVAGTPTRWSIGWSVMMSRGASLLAGVARGELKPLVDLEERG